MLTLEKARLDRFPLKIGDRVKITWGAPKGRIDHGNIHDLHTSFQGGTTVVHAIMVKIDGVENPMVVGFDCLNKIYQ